MLKLYDYYRSSACYRVRIALNLKQLDYSLIPVHLLNNGGEQHAESYKKINPLELVPSLDVNNQTITQSLAIIEFLEETYPQPALLPANPYQRAITRSYAYMIAADIHPLNNLRVLNYLTTHIGVSAEAKNEWYKHWVALGLQSLEKLLQQQFAGDFCVGDSPTLADVCLIPQLFSARRFQCDVSGLRNLLRIEANCLKLNAFADAQPLDPKAQENSHA